MATETNKHLFWEGNKVQHFWSQLSTYLKDQHITNNLDWFQICFGKYDSKQLFLNLCIIVGKY